MIVLLLVSQACQKSQFSVTTRHSRNGRVIYARHYRHEQLRYPKVKTQKNSAGYARDQNSSPVPVKSEMQSLPGYGINRISPGSAYGSGELLASNSGIPVILAVNENRMITDDKLIGTVNQKHIDNTDTVGNKKAGQEKPLQTLGKRIIKFKDGWMAVGKILYQSADTLKYKPAEKDTVLTVQMSNVEKVLPDTRKMEPLGIIALISSLLAFIPFLLGLIPAFGIPLAVIGIILGIISLRRIRHHIDKYKGTGFGKAGLVIGIGAMLLILILLFSMIASAFSSCSSITYSV